MARQIPNAEDLATGTPTAGTVPVSAGPGTPPAWGAGGGGGGADFVKLAEVVVSSAQAVILLPATGAFPTGYKSYEVRGLLLGQFTGTWAIFRVNADSSFIYDRQRIRMDGTGSVLADAIDGDGSVYGPYLNGPTLYGSSNLSCEFYLRINQPESTTAWKSIYWQGHSWLGTAAGSSSSSQDVQAAGRWRSTAAITSMQFEINDASLFQPGSWVAVYGLK